MAGGNEGVETGGLNAEVFGDSFGANGGQG